MKYVAKSNFHADRHEEKKAYKIGEEVKVRPDLEKELLKEGLIAQCPKEKAEIEKQELIKKAKEEGKAEAKAEAKAKGKK